MRQAALLRRAIVLLAFIAGSTPIAPAANPAAFTLALDGPVAAAHAPYIHAIASGAFSTTGLAVSIRYPEGRGAALGVLVSGGADACIADAVSILAARAGGAKITIVASIGDLHPACLVSRVESAITTPVSLAGRRVAIGPLDADRLLFPLFLAGAKLHADDVTTVPLDDAGREAALAAGTVDAVLDRLENGRPGRTILPWAGYGFTLYGPCLAVRDETLRTRPTTVRVFLKQTLAVWEACLQKPAAAARSAAASGLVTPEAAEAWLAAARYRFDTETYRTKGLGWIDRSRMTATLEAVRGTLGQPVTFAAADAFSTAYLPVPAVLRKIDETAAPASETTPLKR
jgi:ABC-type nitrate/sulfonate/bicarbonate transport system substrate-binding protein